MTWVLKVRGAHSQPIALDFLCPVCGPCSLTVEDRDCDGVPCPDGCGEIADRVMSAPFGAVDHVSVVRGSVAKPDSPLYLDTRALGEGMSMQEFKAKREKIDQEKRWKDAREYDRFCKGSV